jgi:general secretion pathway protein J
MTVPRARHPAPRAAPSAGFTLLELLVALALIGLMAVVLSGGLRFGARVWEASRQATEAVGEVAAVRAFLRRRIAAVQPLPFARQAGVVGGALDGAGDALQFVTLMPPHVGRGGFHHVALAMAQGGRGLRLGWWPLGGAPDGPGSGTRLLLRGAEAIEISYFGALRDGDAEAWRTDWPAGQGLPRLLGIKLRFPEGDPRFWPELIVPIRAAGSGARTGAAAGRARKWE